MTPSREDVERVLRETPCWECELTFAQHEALEKPEHDFFPDYPEMAARVLALFERRTG